MERARLVLQFAFVMAFLVAFGVSAAPCLLNNTDQVGNPVFGATVGTFVGLGINPNTTCIENGVWANPKNFSLGNYIKGADGQGIGTDPTVLGAYNLNGSPAANANALDWAWVQDLGNQGTFSGAAGGAPSHGLIWDLGGQANQAAVFVFVDHGPVPGEVLENTVWLSNNPNAADNGWVQAELVHVYGGGWSGDPDIADGFVPVYKLPGNQTFRYVSVTWGGPGSVLRDGDNEIDAVGGLTVDGTGVVTPEPSTYSMMAAGLIAAAIISRRKRNQRA